MENASIATIAGRAWACSFRFNAVVSQAGRTTPELDDQLARFNIWAANLGVFAEAHASLDYRVRNSPKVKAMMMQLLQGLQRKLQFALDAVARNDQTHSVNDLSAVADFQIDDNDSESSNSGADLSSTLSSNSSQTSNRSRIRSDPLDKSVKDIEAAINRLHRLAMLIRSSSTHNRNFTAAKFAIIDENGDDASTQFESFALRVVEAKFPGADPVLHKRLGNLILQRRKMFDYQQRHQQKLAKVAYPEPPRSASQQLLRKDPRIEFAQSTYSQERSVSPRSRTLLQGLVTNKALSSTTATALTATSIMSYPASSVVSSSVGSSTAHKTEVSFPPAPKLATNAKEFQCPYCGLLLGVKERRPRRWRQHIISDLEPYVCLFEHCNMDNQSFRSVDDWIKHMKWAHTLRWYCGVPSCQNRVFDEQPSFENHMELFHPGTYSSSQLTMLGESMRRPVTQVFQFCPLCNYVPESQPPSVGNQRTPVHVVAGGGLLKHVAAHLEEIALFSLPWRDDVDDASTNTASQSREKRSTFNNADLGGFEELSLSFDDPPKLELLGAELQEHENISQSEVITFSIREAEWGFVPLLPYNDHSQDRILQSLIRKYWSTRAEEPDVKHMAGCRSEVDYTRVELHMICDWISPMDFTAKHEHMLAMRQERTCEWFIQSPPVTDFIAHPGKVLWTVGIPGSGKTILSSATIDYLTQFMSSSSHRTAVAYAYCDYRMRESQTAFGLVACFLRQLLEAFWEINKTIPNDVETTFKLRKEDKESPSMTDCVKMLATVITGFASVFVVIDALDECSPATRKELIGTLMSLKPNIHLLITSRYIGDIKDILGDVPRIDVCAPKEDLKRYAEGCIEKYPDLQLILRTLPDAVREGYLGNIVESAAGLFLVVHSLVQSWAGDLSRLGAGPPPSSLAFRDVDAFYHEILMRVFHESRPEAIVARKVLVWVALSRRPVTVNEITDVIRAQGGVLTSLHGEPAGSELLTTVCDGTLVIDTKTGTLQTAHATLKEYLLRHQEKIVTQAQEYITASCVEYLSLETFKDGPCTTDQAMLARLRQHPFLHYAATEWGYHARGAAETSCTDVIISFLSNRFTVESAIQAKSMPSDWQFYPQSIDSKSYPHEVGGIALAAFFGLATIVKAMLNNSGNKTNEEAFFWAATGGSVEVIKLLLTQGTTPNVGGVMKAAAENGYENIIRILVANGGDVNGESHQYDGNALQAAAIKGNESLIRCLLELGADPNRGGEELGSVLHIAAVNGDENITRLLLENGADPNTKGGMYGFALQAAVEEGHENIIQMLLDNGAEVNLEGGPYGNAFQAAVENGDRDIVELLLAHGANINTMIGGEKYTALQEVARRGLEEMVDLLIDKGANIDSRQRNGQTALHQAAKEGQAKVVALLLRKGANHNIKDQRGLTALDWAKKKNFPEVVSILEAA